jgi:antitoxin component HigA of HigAB toxin-antitoxin module
MFGELVSFVDALRSTVQDFRSRQLNAQREAVISALLSTYFYLKDATDEGELLVEDAKPNPVEVIKALEPAKAKERLARWNIALRRQTFRLMRVSDLIYGQEFIDIVSPNLRERLYDVLGNKFNRVNSLHGIGAALFFHGWADSSPEEQAQYVSIMAGEKKNLLHMEKIRVEISALRETMEEYRLTINQLSTPDEIIRLTAKARAETKPPNESLA